MHPLPGRLHAMTHHLQVFIQNEQNISASHYSYKPLGKADRIFQNGRIFVGILGIFRENKMTDLHERPTTKFGYVTEVQSIQLKSLLATEARGYRPISRFSANQIAPFQPCDTKLAVRSEFLIILTKIEIATKLKYLHGIFFDKSVEARFGRRDALPQFVACLETYLISSRNYIHFPLEKY